MNSGRKLCWLCAAGLALVTIDTGAEDVTRVKIAQASSEAQPAFASLPAHERARFRAPEGFVIEEAAAEDLTGSGIAFTFDHDGRPLIGVEGRGVRTLFDRDGDGIYDDYIELSSDLTSAQGLYEAQPGTYLVQAGGPEGAGLYRAVDEDGDFQSEAIELLIKSDAGIQEHGPHAIRMGPDGSFYIMYGNHAHPEMEIDPASPSRNLQEDYLLPRYVDPRGHANSIRVPGGTVNRIDTKFERLEQIAAGFRNSYDFDFDATGEIFTFESDMEWDIGLPWFRPVRVVHVVPGGDYGWRTGSTKKPFYAIDTLPSVDNIGRGSPVGVRFYDHHAYPAHYRGALFLGDWSRGRIRIIFPQQDGATFSGQTHDFVIGEPLNVTDVDVGPDGFLYFTTGGRSTHGGLYRVRYTGETHTREANSAIDAALTQPQPRSAWGKQRLREIKEELGETEWAEQLRQAAQDETHDAADRIRAMELLQVLGPAPSPALLASSAKTRAPEVRAFAAYLLGTHPLSESREPLRALLLDSDPLVIRRTCEALVRTRIESATDTETEQTQFFALLDHPDRLVRHAARKALTRLPADAWAPRVLRDDVSVRPRGAIEGLLALIESGEYASYAEQVVSKLKDYGTAELGNDALLNYLRVAQLAVLRAPEPGAARSELRGQVSGAMLQRFPHDDWRVNRELQRLLAGLHEDDAIPPLLDYLGKTDDPAEQIHTAYCLRAIPDGWDSEERERFVGWYDTAWDIDGGASMEGYIANLWDSTMELLPDAERAGAEAHKDAFMAQRREEALALMAELQEEAAGKTSDLAQRSFEELAEYLEYDPMAYRRPDLERGRKVFLRSRCADCHIFGEYGNGGGPDLSTVAGRFRRSDLLESIMFPSKVISDQYTAVNVELKDGTFYTGMVVGENRRRLTLITADGERVDVPKSDIRDRFEARTSVMPEGLLETMDMGDLVALIQFLENGGS